MKKIKILLADDHFIITDGIIAMLSQLDEYEIIGEARDGIETIEKVKELNPDILIIDISMPKMNGIEVTKKIRETNNKLKILVLTQHDKKEYVFQMLKAGADGYLLKNSNKNELITALNAISDGNKYFGKKISDIVLNNYVSNNNSQDEEYIQPNVLLTKRELEIIKLIVKDKNNQEIADSLNISLRTVETHRRNIMQKLNVKTVVALVRYALNNNITSL
ncbi:MAG: hypothetical protein A2046_15485 [Bacteroidetes bacterium GWA2_30_7]|nr:MAG: hypothetical protein A2046_15485 [Bacteroidetes bacterium GWA2_30_7]